MSDELDRRISRCRSCHAPIVWFKTTNGKNIPVDADGVAERDKELDTRKHVVHFRTCPNATLHRRR